MVWSRPARWTALAAAMAITACIPALAAPEQVQRSEQADFRVVEVVGGLEHPWAVAFLPDGRLLITERPGRLRLIENGHLRDAPIDGVPEVYAGGQGGLLDMALAPGFASNKVLYLSYAHGSSRRV